VAGVLLIALLLARREGLALGIFLVAGGAIILPVALRSGELRGWHRVKGW
jgi:biotin transporter BioY